MIDEQIFKDVTIRDGYAFFLKGWLSNWYRSPFTASFMGETRDFFCVEQAFMFAKALFFEDTDTAEKIAAETSSARRCKDLGRSVRGYDEEKWEKARYGIMLAAVDEKFSQNRELLGCLMRPEFDGLKFVEANPSDSVWSIGMSVEDPDVCDESKWKGRNLLGQAIQKVRDWNRSVGNMTVGDLVKKLQGLNQDAFVVRAEMNAFDYGFWQPIPRDRIDLAVRTLGEIRESEKNGPAANSVKWQDYVYVEDDDVVLGT